MFYYLISKSSYLKESKDKYIQVLIYGTISYIILHALFISKSNKFKYLENYFWSIFSIDCISIYSELKNNLDNGVSINTRQKTAIKKKSEKNNLESTQEDLNKLTSKLDKLNNKINNSKNQIVSSPIIKNSQVNNINQVKTQNQIKTDSHTNFTDQNTFNEIQAVNQNIAMDLNNISNHNLNNLSNFNTSKSNKYTNNLSKAPELEINQDIKGINQMINNYSVENKSKSLNQNNETIISLDTSDEEDTDVGSDIDINLFEKSL